MKQIPRRMLALGAVALLAVFLAVWLLQSRGAESSKTQKKLIVLGIDGMDPQLLQQYMAEGIMPNFAALAARGSVLPLETSIPPQNPVAWSNLIPGIKPARHATSDSIRRKPPTMTPHFSTSPLTP